jgi:DNA-directed RNA polymerase specialized sigma24 family protein
VDDVAQLRPAGNPDRSPSYLLKAAHNAAIDEIRRRIRRPEVGIEDDGEAHAVEAGAADPARRAESREIDRAIRLSACSSPPRGSSVGEKHCR